MMKIKMMAVMVATAMSFSTYAAGTNINITGKVVASPCIVNGGNTDLDVTLDDIPADTMQTAGTSSAEKPFTLALTNCPLGTSNVIATFTGTSDPVAGANYYRNTGTATNIAVALVQASTGNLKGSGTTITQGVSGGNATFALKAKTYTSVGGVTPGTVRATVVASMTYN